MNSGRDRQSLTRAEQLRLKRQQADAQKRQQAPVKKYPQVPAQQRPPATRSSLTRNISHGSPSTNRSVPHVSPVVTRSIRYGTPLRQAVNTQPRRKVVYRVGANGVETRMPSLPIIQFNWQWVSAFLTLAFLVLALMLTNSSIFAVNRIEVEGMQRVTAADIQAVVMTTTHSVFTLDRQKTLDAIAVAFPELKDIRLTINLPDGVKISAVERQPIMAWKTSDQLYWIDAEGVVMQPRGDVGELLTVSSESTPPMVKPVTKVESIVDYAETVLNKETDPIKPEESINYLNPAVLKAAIQMSAIMPQGASLVYDSLAGMGWNDPGGWKVFFGNDLENIQFKQVEYQAIIEELQRQGITPVMVSVKHVDSPYYRTE